MAQSSLTSLLFRKVSRNRLNIYRCLSKTLWLSSFSQILNSKSWNIPNNRQYFRTMEGNWLLQVVCGLVNSKRRKHLIPEVTISLYHHDQFSVAPCSFVVYSKVADAPVIQCQKVVSFINDRWKLVIWKEF